MSYVGWNGRDSWTEWCNMSAERQRGEICVTKWRPHNGHHYQHVSTYGDIVVRDGNKRKFVCSRRLIFGWPNSFRSQVIHLAKCRFFGSESEYKIVSLSA